MKKEYSDNEPRVVRRVAAMNLGDRISLRSVAAEIERGNLGEKRNAWWKLSARSSFCIPGGRLVWWTNDTHYTLTENATNDRADRADGANGADDLTATN